MVVVHRYWSGRRVIAALAVAAVAAATVSLAVSVRGFANGADITFQPGDNVNGTEPVAVGADSIVGRFVDPDNVGQITITAPAPKVDIPLCGDPSIYTATINWGDGSAADTGTVDCDTSGTSQYAVFSDNNHTYQDSGTYHISVTVDDRPAGTDSQPDADTAQTATATVSDADISATSTTNLRGGGEGGNVEGATVGASAFFFDSNTAFADADTVDPGLTATINWGDGTTSPASTIAWPPDCGECGNVEVGGSHVYDANIPATKPYSVTITLHDDGGKSATSGAADTPAFADAKLTAGTAKSFISTATQASSHVVASFTDAAGAQAAAADFTATIKWGDNTTSSGTISKTAAGAFDVSGTHTYATSGTKSLTITVTDEEGQTVSMTATATVAAAPVVLPATGQPHGSATPGGPLLPLMLLLLGLVALSTGLARVRSVRGRR